MKSDEELAWLFETGKDVGCSNDVEDDPEWESIDDPEWKMILEDEGKPLSPEQIEEVIKLLS